MRPIQKTISYAAADANSAVEAETPVDGVDLTLGGAFASGGVVTFPEATTVDFTSADDISDVTFAIVGTDANGLHQTDTVTGVNNDTVSSGKLFLTITSISVATVTTYTTETVEVGNPDTPSFGTGPWWPLDIYVPNQVTTISVNELSGSITYSVEYTNEDPFDTSITQLAVAHPATGGAFTGATTDQTHFTTTLMRAVRVNFTAGSGSARVTVVQQSTQ
jgi:hypothetical protein